MSIFDLLFLLLLLISAVTLLAAMGCALFGRFARAGRIVRALLVCAAIYLGIVAVVSLGRPRKTFGIGEPLCFDDWCIDVESVEPQGTGAEASYVVNLHLSSAGRGALLSARTILSFT